MSLIAWLRNSQFARRLLLKIRGNSSPGKPARARLLPSRNRIRPAVEVLEVRTTPSISVTNSGGVVTANFDDSYTELLVQHSGTTTYLGDATHDQGGDSWSFPDSSFTSIQLNMGAGNDDINLYETPAQHPITVSGGGQNSHIYVLANSVQSPVTLRDIVGYASLQVDDGLDTSFRNVTVTASSITGLGAGFNYVQDELRGLQVLTGQGGSVVNVLGTPDDEVHPFATLVVGKSADDTVNVGNGNVEGIAGALRIFNTRSATTVNINDQNDRTFRTAVLGSTTLDGKPNGRVSGLSPMPI